MDTLKSLLQGPQGNFPRNFRAHPAFWRDSLGHSQGHFRYISGPKTPAAGRVFLKAKPCSSFSCFLGNSLRASLAGNSSFCEPFPFFSRNLKRFGSEKNLCFFLVIFPCFSTKKKEESKEKKMRESLSQRRKIHPKKCTQNKNVHLNKFF